MFSAWFFSTVHKLLHSGEKDYSMKEKEKIEPARVCWVGDGANGTEERGGKKDCLPRGLRKCKQGVGGLRREEERGGGPTNRSRKPSRRPT